ncbi:response regulator transcription factor [Paenibacillus sacheonensis]|uniref:Response regulator n=1 Tax=Paenibacillus sacheonensis TaxID=742054 RepID=A0A7X4YQ38_9BACL|nr:response regulator [Paenibacillus sacheonensis]MBM7566212.1 two-component system response regulator YesN [Paenibacillus sacheonensis]NBC70420.1 response regulator [Paenibacillus sacheonensis]
MHKALIVDDESWVVESLKDLVDWERHGFEIIGQAHNGAEALALMKELKPDVVFTDIRMPEMSGLELIQRGRSLGLPILFVVVSGYAEFAYAQKAISYGAVAYCLKPFDDMEISGVLHKLDGMLTKAKAMPSPASPLLQYLLETGEDSRQKLLDELERAGFGDWSANGIVPIAAVGSGELELRGPKLRLKTGASKTVYLLPAEQAIALGKAWTSRIPDGLSGIGIGGVIKDLAEVRAGIDAADALAHQFFVTREIGAYASRTFRQEELNLRLADMSEAIAGRAQPAIEQAFKSIGELFGSGALSIRHAFQVYNLTVSFLFKLGQTEETLYSYEQLLHAYRDVYDMLAALEALAARDMIPAEPAPSIETKNRSFASILQFVTEHYREELSLQGLSEQFYLNPSYISQLFRKEVGETLTGYIARLRIEQAQELLKGDGDSIQEIAEKIGYRDYFYFTRLFKKITGKTPSRYRSERE